MSPVLRVMIRLVSPAALLAAASCTHLDRDGDSASDQPSGDSSDQRNAPAANPTDPMAVGYRFHVRPQDLPAPYAEPSVSNAPLVVPRGDRVPQVPGGFRAVLVAEGLEHPRRLLVLPNGDLIVAEQKVGYLTLLRDDDGDGRAEWVERHAEGFKGPYGLAWRDGEILVADQVGIWAVPHKLGEVRAGHGEQKPIHEVPPEERRPDPNAYGQKLITREGAFGLVAGHVNRDLEIAPDGRLYVGVGSSGNIGEEPELKATIQVFSPDGQDQRTYASGARNPTDLAFHPSTGALWAIVQERDGLGDRLVPDYLIAVREGGFYGWPYSYIGSNPQPGYAERAPEKVNAAITPDLLFEAHASAMGLVFYDGASFPEEYRGDAFVALKGSWNRSQPVGYSVVRVPFSGDRPQGEYENFVTGFRVDDRERAEVWGRPAALALAKNGDLLIADDTGGTIWRIISTGDGGARADGASTGTGRR